MEIKILETELELGQAAAAEAASILNTAIADQGHAAIIAATGASQLEFLKQLILDKTVDWSKITMFHLDEYVGLPESHPASFRKYLRERLIERVRPLECYLIEGDADDPLQEVERINNIISGYSIDLALVGVGENAHLAFNDPPADFDTELPYIIVELDKACRQQQVSEGWFSDVSEVPDKAISMSVKQIMKSEAIIAVVPHARKAMAIKNCFIGTEISNRQPASIMKNHANATIFLDRESAALLD